MPDKPSLADRMKPRPPAAQPAGSVSEYFKAPEEELTKRLTLDMSKAQHRKLKMHAVREGSDMAKILRAYVDTLPEV